MKFTERDEHLFRIGYLSAWTEVSDLVSKWGAGEESIDALLVMAKLANIALERMSTPPSADEKVKTFVPAGLL